MSAVVRWGTMMSYFALESNCNRRRRFTQGLRKAGRTGHFSIVDWRVGPALHFMHCQEPRSACILAMHRLGGSTLDMHFSRHVHIGPLPMETNSY